MIKTSIEKLSRDIGFDIGNSDDETQANLLNGFCEGLANSMDESKLEKQLCYMVDHLNKKSGRVLRALVDFIKIKEKE